MLEASTVLFLLGFIIFVGYFSLKFFERMKIPDIIILMLLGLILGPLYNILGEGSVGLFRLIMPIVSAIALILILFESGLNLNFFKVLKTLGTATLFTIAVSGLSVIAVAAAAFFIFGWPLLVCLLFGIIVGGTDSAVVVSLINKTSASEDTKMLIDLETTINDVLIVFAFAVAGIITAQAVDISAVGQQILGSFSISAVAGLVAAIAWLKVKDHLKGGKYEYILTLAVIFLLYAFVEYFRANGAIAAFVFGIILGNAGEIATMLKINVREVDGKIALFQEEISFLVRTVFFVYLGVVFEIGAISLVALAAGMVFVIVIAFSRFGAARIILGKSKKFKEDLKLITSSMSRGIAAAVLASVPLSIGLPQGKDIFYLAFIVILFSNVFTTAGIFLSERGREGQKPTDENVEEIRV